MDLEDFLQPLRIDNDLLHVLSRELSDVYRHLAQNSTEQFLATPVNVLPEGTEKGRFLAIDVGGSNLRVGFIDLMGKCGPTGVETIQRRYERSWPIGDHLKMEKAQILFSWIGECIAQVVAHCIEDTIDLETNPMPLGEVLPIGITFSFPMIQSSIGEATLMPMGKGFAITSDLNLGRMILAGYSMHVNHQCRRGSHPKMGSVRLPELKIAAITNDAVATLASLAYENGSKSGNSRVAMGVIVGTGTNATIMMQLDSLHQSKQDAITLPATPDSRRPSVAVNTEWTISGSAPPLHKLGLVTKWDRQLDMACEAPGFQPFEYMTSGRYLGELVRLALFDWLVNVRKINPSHLPGGLLLRNKVPTFFLSSKVAPSASGAELLPHLIEEYPVPSEEHWVWDEEVAGVLLTITKAFQFRSSQMIAAAIIGLLACAGELGFKTPTANNHSNHADRPGELVVAYTGGVIGAFPSYLQNCQESIDHLVQEVVDTKKVERVVLQRVDHGGIIGAGVLAGTTIAAAKQGHTSPPLSSLARQRQSRSNCVRWLVNKFRSCYTVFDVSAETRKASSATTATTLEFETVKELHALKA